MKAVINEKETPVKEREYPWIGEATDSPGFIVAFWSEESATCLIDRDDYKKGESYPSRKSNLFTPFTGTITLSND